MKPRYNKSVVLSTGTAIKDLPRVVEEATAEEKNEFLLTVKQVIMYKEK